MTTHYILTRFNIRLWGADKNSQSTLDDAWLDARFALFEKYCLPSVAHQTEKNFSWIVLFDRDTPQPYKDRLQSLRDQCPALRPIFVRPDAGHLFRVVFREVIARDIALQRERGIQVDKVITTYLDNDDAISTHYVATVQRLAAPLGDKTYITFYYGLQYFEDMNIATRVRYRENHFNSFVEVPDDKGRVLTTYCCSHALIFKSRQFAIHRVIDKQQPMWAEIVHPRNVMNDILLRRPTTLVRDRHILPSQFGVDVVLSSGGGKIFCTTFLWRMLQAYVRYFRRRLRGY